MHVLAPFRQPSSPRELLSALLALVNDLLPGGVSFYFVVVSSDGRQSKVDHCLLPGWAMVGGEATVPFYCQEVRILVQEGYA